MKPWIAVSVAALAASLACSCSDDGDGQSISLSGRVDANSGTSDTSEDVADATPDAAAEDVAPDGPPDLGEDTGPDLVDTGPDLEDLPPGFCGNAGGFWGQLSTIRAPRLYGVNELGAVVAAAPANDGEEIGVSMFIASALVNVTAAAPNDKRDFWLLDEDAGVRVQLTSDAASTLAPGAQLNVTVTKIANRDGNPVITDGTFNHASNYYTYADESTGDVLGPLDYGQTVRVTGVLGPETDCGTGLKCYVLTHVDQTITLRKGALPAVAEGDCVSFVGPLYGAPGPLDPNPVPILDVINPEWLKKL